MSKYAFGKTSVSRLETCHADLIVFAHTAILNAPFDMGVVCGVRYEAEQEKAFAKGRSLARYGQSPHNPPKAATAEEIAAYKSFAVDLSPYKNGDYVWDDNEGDYTILIEYLQGVANGLFESGAIENRIEQITRFRDLPHWQIRGWKGLR